MIKRPPHLLRRTFKGKWFSEEVVWIHQPEAMRNFKGESERGEKVEKPIRCVTSPPVHPRRRGFEGETTGRRDAYRRRKDVLSHGEGRSGRRRHLRMERIEIPCQRNDALGRVQLDFLRKDGREK